MERSELAHKPAGDAPGVRGLSPRGARTQQILASVIRTARQRHVDLDDLFTTLLRAPRPIVPAAFHLQTQ